jgi:hypothetical protein
MSFQVVQFEPTPNPNAVKCHLNRPISDRPRSFLNATMAAGDPIAAALFATAGATTVLFNVDWVTVNKPPAAPWAMVKRQIRQVLAGASEPAATKHDKPRRPARR